MNSAPVSRPADAALSFEEPSFDRQNSESAWLAPDFNGLARAYRWLEMLCFGPFLLRCRCAFLDRVGGYRKALVIGDGDGRFTARLLSENPSIKINALDASFAMLSELMRNAGRHAGRVRLELGDARAWKPDSSRYDLLVTHFFLDCLTTDEVLALAVKLHSCLGPDARWVISEFAIPESRFGRMVARPVIAVLYRAFGLLTGLKIRSLPDHRTALEQAGFSIVQKRSWIFGLLASELWAPNARNSVEFLQDQQSFSQVAK
jgi:ubiquinone/menaquinone biosynthesis C-methylase UbiE